MTQDLGVRVLISYWDDQDGVATFPGCPEELEFPELLFAEQVNNQVFFDAFLKRMTELQMSLPDGTTITWVSYDKLTGAKRN
jgi:hypothetical protein